MGAEDEGIGAGRTTLTRDEAWELRCGCFAAFLVALFGLPVALLVAVPFGDCGGEAACHEGEGARFAVALAIVAGVGILVLNGARWAARRLGARRAEIAFVFVATLALGFILWMGLELARL